MVRRPLGPSRHCIPPLGAPHTGIHREIMPPGAPERRRTSLILRALRRGRDNRPHRSDGGRIQCDQVTQVRNWGIRPAHPVRAEHCRMLSGALPSARCRARPRLYFPERRLRIRPLYFGTPQKQRPSALPALALKLGRAERTGTAPDATSRPCPDRAGESAPDLRREWDSNPRRPRSRGFSRAVHSSALPSLRTRPRVAARSGHPPGPRIATGEGAPRLRPPRAGPPPMGATPPMD